MELKTLDGRAVSSEELNLIRRYRQKRDFELGFYAGLLAGQEHLNALANECGGGSGTGTTADTYRSAAIALKAVNAPKDKS